MSEHLLDAENWRVEANAVVRDIGKHVRKIDVLDSTDQLIYFNLTTIEGKDFCVELSGNGFRVVGTSHNQKNDSSDEYFETPYTLLNKISPTFQQSFGNELVEKLNNLADT
jgi:hypothetical protein